MDQKDVLDTIRESNDSEVRRNSMYGEIFKDIISKAAKESDR